LHLNPPRRRPWHDRMETLWPASARVELPPVLSLDSRCDARSCPLFTRFLTLIFHPMIIPPPPSSPLFFYSSMLSNQITDLQPTESLSLFFYCIRFLFCMCPPCTRYPPQKTFLSPSSFGVPLVLRFKPFVPHLLVCPPFRPYQPIGSDPPPLLHCYDSRQFSRLPTSSVNL